MAAVGIFAFILLFFSGLPPGSCYDTEDYEIFDLVEEINQNFYELFEIKQDATVSEIKKSYRRLAVQYHPDKNKEADAEEKFRQIASIYEVLKDENKRQKYDLVLEVGLPDWKQPVFYYRRVRKLGLLELCAILLIILTVGHFLVLWASYFERKFEMEEVFRSRQKKERKVRGRAKSQQEAREAEFEEQLHEQLESVARPRLTDLVPFRLVALCWWSVVYVWRTPGRVREWRARREEERREEEAVRLAEEERRESLRKLQEAQKARRKKPVDLATLRAEMMSVEGRTSPVIYGVDSDDKLQDSPEIDLSTMETSKDGEAWTEEHTSKLAKAVAKFPGGTAKRWEKISQMVGRPVKEVIVMSKNIRQEYTRSVDPSTQGITGDSNTRMVSDTVMTQNEWLNGVQSVPVNDLDLDSAVISAGNAAVRRRRGQRSNSSAERNVSGVNMRHAPNSNSTTKSRDDAKSQGDATSNSVVTTNKVDSNKELRTKDSESSQVPPSNTTESSQTWSQPQQKVLEQALISIPKGTADRWGKISEQIPGKSKEECIARYKYLAEVVKKRKTQQQKS